MYSQQGHASMLQQQSSHASSAAG